MAVVGDQDRVEAVYRSVHPRLWRSLLAYTGDAELASDAEAEAFAQVLRRGDPSTMSRRGVGVVRPALPRVSWRPGRARRMRPAYGSMPSTGSVAEFLGLLAELSSQQRACVAFVRRRIHVIGDRRAVGTSAGTVRVQLNRAHAALRHTITEAEHA